MFALSQPHPAPSLPPFCYNQAAPLAWFRCQELFLPTLPATLCLIPIDWQELSDTELICAVLASVIWQGEWGGGQVRRY